MSDARHTKGPWRRNQYAVRAQSKLKDGSKFDALVAFTASTGSPPYEECRANAQLIAAAPEMLEALELAQASLSRLLNRDAANPAVELNALKQARAAINKAKGLQ